MNNENLEHFDLNEEKLKKIIIKILTLENDNVKTKEFNDEEIKRKIQKIIEEEILCY